MSDSIGRHQYRGIAARLSEKWFDAYAHYSFRDTDGIQIENDQLITPTVLSDNIPPDTIPLNPVKAHLDSLIKTRN